MPSSLIFTGLVVLWLLILVPAVARHQQEVARPSGASLAGRVLARPRRRMQARRNGRLPTEEGDIVDPERLDQDDTPTARETERPWGSTATGVPAMLTVEPGSTFPSTTTLSAASFFALLSTAIVSFASL